MKRFAKSVWALTKVFAYIFAAMALLIFAVNNNNVIALFLAGYLCLAAAVWAVSSARWYYNKGCESLVSTLLY